MQEELIHIYLEHIDRQAQHAQWLYDQNEKARRDRYRVDMDYVRDRLERSSRSPNDYRFQSAVLKYRNAYEYYKLRDEQSFHKNTSAFHSKIGVLKRRRDRLLEKLRNLPARIEEN